MRTFINKKTGSKWLANDCDVKEGQDTWYIKSVNVSMPKSDWEEKKDTGCTKAP